MTSLPFAVSNFSNFTNFTNFSILDSDEFFQSLEAIGPKAQLCLILLYSATALLALSGNCVAIIVLVKGQRSSRDLRVFLVNLSLSDVAMAIFSIPFTYTDFVLGRWIFLPAFCPAVQFLQHCSVCVSVYTLTAIGLDRYYAVMSPLHSRWTKSRGGVIVIAIWCCALVLSSFQLIHGKAEKFIIGGNEIYDCSEVWDEFDGKVYAVTVFVLTFVLPMLVLSFVYGCIGIKMWKHTVPGNADASRDQQQIMAKMKVAKMMATVVLLFALCWLPIQVFALLVYLAPERVLPQTDDQFPAFAAMFILCHWLSMANSFANPFIYCFMSDNFRTDLKQLLACQQRKPRCIDRSRKGCSFRTTTLVVTSSTKTQEALMLNSLHPDTFDNKIFHLQE